MNRINLTGRLTRDPELVSLPDSETVVCRMRLAVDGMAPSRDTGYIDVSTFGKPGEAAASVLSKGWLVAVDGRLEYRTWDDNGSTRHAYQVIGNVEFLAAPRSAGGNSTERPVEPAAA